MLGINDLKIGTHIVYKEEPYVVISSRHVKLGRGGAIQQTKLKSLITGNVTRRNFKGNERFEEPDLTSKRAQFLYQDGKFHFMDQETYEQFSLTEEQLGSKAKFLKDGSEVDILNFKDKPINIDIPLKIVLKVIEAPPGVKGDTAQKSGATKQVTLETGAKISAPLFVKKGDAIKVNTETGEYIERG